MHALSTPVRGEKVNLLKVLYNNKITANSGIIWQETPDIE